MTYVWTDNNTGTTVSVERKVADMEVPPTEEEVVAAGMESKEYNEADWVRNISGGIGHIGFGGKGNW